MSVLLDKPSVQVSTVHVEIKALMVGKKQFTIAMLKQLPRDDTLDGVGHYVTHNGRTGFVPNGRNAFEQLEGNVWGYVRYRLSATSMIHVIVERDGRLYRVSTTGADALRHIGVNPDDLDQLFIAV